MGVVALPPAIGRLLRMACAFAVLLTIAAPSALGASMGPVMKELGALAQQHVCKCGMPVGKCGCPECARLEHEHNREQMPDAVPVLKSRCDDDAPLAPATLLPMGVLTALTDTLPPARGERLAICAVPSPPRLPTDEPPTPPPRSASL